MDLESIGGANLRVTLAGSEWRGHALETVAFGSDSGRASGGVAILGLTKAGTGVLALTTRAAGGRKAVLASGVRLSWLEDGASDSLAALRWSVPAGASYERGVLAAEELGPPAATPDLVPVGDAYALHPRDLALRSAIRVGLEAPSVKGEGAIGLYLERGEGWEFIRSERGLGGRLVGETRRLGRFALFRDARAPRITVLAGGKRAAAEAYPRWALEARLDEDGSGVDPRASYLEIDGRRVPSEWDPEEHVLRWRPRARSNGERHRVRVVAVDRAGNSARTNSTFVLE